MLKEGVILTIADKGYYSALQFSKCAEAGIIPVVSEADHSNRLTDKYTKEIFKYDNEKGGYIYPNGALLLPYILRIITDTTKENMYYRNEEARLNCNLSNNGKMETMFF